MDANPLHRHGNSGAVGQMHGWLADWTSIGTRRLSRIAVLAVVISQAAFVALAVPALFAQRRTPPPAIELGLTRLGLTPALYAAYVTLVLVAFAVGCFVVSALVARRRFDGIAQLTVLLLVLMGAASAPNAAATVERWPALAPFAHASQFLLYATLIFFLCRFPDGRFVPRWTRVGASALLTLLLLALLRTGDNLSDPASSVVVATLIGGLVLGVGVQVYRFLKVSGSEERRQTSWVVGGLVVAILLQLAFILLAEPFRALTRPGVPALLYDLIDLTGITLAYFLIPLGLAAAILRCWLWGIEVLVNRALVYGTLTAAVAGGYALFVGAAGLLVDARGNALVAMLATGLVAVLFQPLRSRLQRGANRLLYGERDDPYAALARLGRQLEETFAPDAILPSVVQTVAEALRVPYAAITLHQEGAIVPAAVAGTPVAGALQLPLRYGSEPVGELVVGPRSPGEAFSPADRRLLEDLARQVGVAAHATRLTADLRRSRERVVTAREEERRSLRRDLHDGLGPALASQTLKAGVARALLAQDPVAAEQLLADLEVDIDAALTDIRRLVYDLRPPALDQLGLIGAIRESATRYQANRPDQLTGTPSLRIVVDGPGSLPVLPAAVEVAAYRIVQEALTNVARHARARSCRVTFALRDGAFQVEVTDNGIGLPQVHRAGVGLASMAERAAELGGTCRVEALPDGGTRVSASLPLPANQTRASNNPGEWSGNNPARSDAADENGDRAPSLRAETG